MVRLEHFEVTFDIYEQSCLVLRKLEALLQCSVDLQFSLLEKEVFCLNLFRKVELNYVFICLNLALKFKNWDIQSLLDGLIHIFWNKAEIQ